MKKATKVRFSMEIKYQSGRSEICTNLTAQQMQEKSAVANALPTVDKVEVWREWR